MCKTTAHMTNFTPQDTGNVLWVWNM